MWNGEEPDRSRLGLTGPPKEWAPIKDYNPDRNPSYSAKFMNQHPDGDYVLMLLQVKGLGVITMRATESDVETGRFKFEGVGIFSKEDIGYCPSL